MTTEKKTCTAHGRDWACDRDAIALDLCQAHYRQQQRGRPLTPLRELGHPKPTVGFRVSPETYELLGDCPGQKAAEIVEAWARRHAAAKGRR